MLLVLVWERAGRATGYHHAHLTRLYRTLKRWFMTKTFHTTVVVRTGAQHANCLGFRWRVNADFHLDMVANISKLSAHFWATACAATPIYAAFYHW